MHNWISYSDNAVSTRFMTDHNEIIAFRLASAKIDVQGKEAYPQNIFARNWFSCNLDCKTFFIDNFLLKEAIERGYLRNYEYDVIKIKVNIPEQFLTKYGADETYNAAIETFYKKATDYAIEYVHEFIKKESTNRLLVYTGPTKKVASELVKRLNKNKPWNSVERVRKFTSDEGSEERIDLLDEFKSGRTKFSL